MRSEPRHRLSTHRGLRALPRPSRGTLALLLAGTLASTGMSALLTAGSASAAVPTFPDNILVFPNRDFVSVQGYADHAGQTATVTVDRPGIGVVGSATAVVSGGDVAFEVNHPGGVCWGNGTSFNVTPDIRPGDVVSISFAGSVVGDTAVQDAFVTEKSTLSGSTLTVTGHVGPGVITDNTEQRIIEPLLVDTAIARRDIRAIPGPLTTAARGGYSSSLEFAGTTFTATYIFDDPAVALIASNASLGERLLSWQFVDGAGNRQGVTIAERGEPGGPGMGGCPNGPLQSGPPAPTNVSSVNVAGGIKVNWTPAVALGGTQPITGYRATAVAQTVSATGEQIEIGRQITNPGATGTTITGLSGTETYDVEVVSESSVGQTFPPAHAIADITAPTISASPVGGSYPVAQQVTLTASEPGSQIFYTTDGTDPVDATGLESATATNYTGAIPIAANATLSFVAVDPSGNVSSIGQQSYVITNTPVPATPTFTTTSAAAGSVTLNWAAVNDPSITGYGVMVYNGAGSLAVGSMRTAPATATSMTITDLPPDLPYKFTIVAINANGSSPESPMVGPLTPLGAVVANAGADQAIIRKVTPTPVTLTGAGSTPGATYLWTQLGTGAVAPISATDPDKVLLTTSGALNSGFTPPLFKYGMTGKLTFRLTVTAASGAFKTDDVVVTLQADQVSIVTARWKLGDFRVTGAGSVSGGTITVHPGVPSPTTAAIVLGQAPMTAATAPATGGVFDLRLRNAAAGTTSPGKVWIESTVGGIAGPFTVG